MFFEHSAHFYSAMRYDENRVSTRWGVLCIGQFFPNFYRNTYYHHTLQLLLLCPWTFNTKPLLSSYIVEAVVRASQYTGRSSKRLKEKRAESSRHRFLQISCQYLHLWISSFSWNLVSWMWRYTFLQQRQLLLPDYWKLLDSPDCSLQSRNR